MLAYENVLLSGGEHTVTLINEVINSELSNLQKAQIFDLTVHIVALYAGSLHYHNLPHRSGFFYYPDTAFLWGILYPTSNEIKLEGTVIREAIFQQLLDFNDTSKFDNIFNTLYTIAPEYISYGRCEYPHPYQHNHVFPFIDGFDCLKKELKDIISDLITDTIYSNYQDYFKILPNPLISLSTIIVDIPSNFNDPKIQIFNLNNTIFKTINLQPGHNEVIIYKSEFSNELLLNLILTNGNTYIYKIKFRLYNDLQVYYSINCLFLFRCSNS